MKRWTILSALAGLAILLGTGTSRACVGTECLEIWSTADGGGALTVRWDFAKPIQTFFRLCAPNGSICLYNSTDQGFLAPTVDDDPNDSQYVLRDGTTVTIVLMPPAPDSGFSLNIDGKTLQQPGDSALLGTMPPIHKHPIWQVLLPPNQVHDYSLSFKLTTDSPAYTESQVFTVVVTNVLPAASSPTPTPTSGPAATPTPCAGDCNHDGTVTVDELLTCVDIALNGGTATCMACDGNGDGEVAVDEILAAVTAALNGCPKVPVATLQEIQDAIFTPRCAIPMCHDAASALQNLNLTAGAAYGDLVNVPSVGGAGMLRVDPGKPDDSFLLLKVEGPPLGEGSVMPPTPPPLSADEVQRIREWILQGAKP